MAITIIVGFGSAFIGAAAGFLGAVYIERWRLRRARLGMIRALIGELRQNATAVVRARYSGLSVRYSGDAWNAANFELAQFLNQQVYEDILFLYMTLPDVLRLSGRGVREDQADPGEAWLNRYHAAINTLVTQLPKEMRFGLARNVDAERGSHPEAN